MALVGFGGLLLRGVLDLWEIAEDTEVSHENNVPLKTPAGREIPVSIYRHTMVIVCMNLTAEVELLEKYA